MRSFLMVGMMMFVAATGGGSGSLCAQIKLAVFDPSGDPSSGLKGVAFQPAKEAADFTHGTLLALTLNDGKRVIGTMVRSDPKTKRIFVRTKPGVVPGAYAETDLKHVEKATRPVSAEGITPAGTATETVVQPEIIKQIIFNGPRRSVRIFSVVVSPGERELLNLIESAENDLLTLEDQAGLRIDAIDTELALQGERLRTQTLINSSMRTNLDAKDRWYILRGTWDLIFHIPLVIPPRTHLSATLPEIDREKLKTAREALKLALQGTVFENGQLVAVVFP